MTTVVWIPGLRGEKTLRSGFSVSAHGQGNEDVVRECAASEGCNFIRIDYQTAEQPTPLLSEMSTIVAHRLAGIIGSRREPLVLVSSSVGVGVTLGALSRIRQTVSPIALMALKPVSDPLQAIEQQIKDHGVLDKLKSGKIPSVPLPVEGDNQDSFPLTRQHVTDSDALRVFNLLAHEDTARDFSLTLINSGVIEISLIYGDADHLTPKPLMDEFHDNVHYIPRNKRRLHGNHATDFRAPLREELDNLIALANDIS